MTHTETDHICTTQWGRRMNEVTTAGGNQWWDCTTHMAIYKMGRIYKMCPMGVHWRSSGIGVVSFLLLKTCKDGMGVWKRRVQILEGKLVPFRSALHRFSSSNESQMERLAAPCMFTGSEKYPSRSSAWRAGDVVIADPWQWWGTVSVHSPCCGRLRCLGYN